MNQIETRYAILEDLYHQSIQRGYLNGQISSELNEKLDAAGVTPEAYRFNLHYLEGKGYIKVVWTLAGISDIKITSEGCDLVEFYKLGLSMNLSNDSAGLDAVLKRIGDSGIKLMEGSALGLINMALSRFLG